jgi:Raf kinase inhibitor-like YbhB/YbcL family protein
MSRTPLVRRSVRATVPIRALAPLATAVLLVACSSDGRTLPDPVFPLPATVPPETTVPPAPPAFDLLAPWPDGAELPTTSTCDGEGLSPALTWVGVPAGTVELAVTVVDLDDALTANWIVYGIDPGLTGLLEGEVPAGAIVGPNAAGETTWAPPCPPSGTSHRFQFSVHALNQQLEVADDATAAEVISAINVVALAQSSVTGTVTRPG